MVWYDDAFLEEVKCEKANLESVMINPNYESNIVLNQKISIHEIEKVVGKLKEGKSPGPDMIPNEVVKCPDIKLLLYRLFSYCFENSMVPSVWLKAIIKPIPKGADKDPYIPLNYRGISLTSCLSKTYSSLLNNRIVSYCNTLNLFVDEQNGFRQKRSCEDHIFSLTSIIRNRLNAKKQTFCAFVDLEKAFDWVQRDLLLFKLIQHYNIDGKIYFAVSSLLSQTMSCVQLSNDLKNPWFPILSGVRQGDTLSPTLFSLFINDLVSHLKVKCPTITINDISLNSLLYADDMVLLSEDEEGLQVLLDEMHSWCKKWRLKVNETKTKIVHFRGPRTKITDYKFVYSGKNIDLVPNYKYLGVIIDEHLKFNSCTTALSDSAGRALGGIIGKFKSLRNVGFETFTKLYSAGVSPILEYGSGIWGFVQANNIDKIHQRAMRYYLGVHKYAPNAGLYSDVGWLSPKYSRYICMLRTWNRFIDMDANRLTKKICLYDKQLGIKNWSSEIEYILQKLDLLHTYNNMEVCDISIVKEKLYKLMQKEWVHEVKNKPKLRTYVMFKDNLDTEDYVKYNFSRHSRSVLAQFRLGILPIRVETGRFRNLELKDRICELCNNQQIEDEIHFLCQCPLYHNTRKILFDRAEAKCPEFIQMNIQSKFSFLVKNMWREVANFLVSALKTRQNKLYQ